jgi:glycosyltransferase involved in cell wall biosynthesis
LHCLGIGIKKRVPKLPLSSYPPVRFVHIGACYSHAMIAKANVKIAESTLSVAPSPVDTMIILSTYNGEAFLAEQLNSLYELMHPNIKIVVRDDGSSDLTKNLLAREQQDARIELLSSSPNIGAAPSFFELLRHAAATTTRYVAFCDQDDVWRPDKISRAVSSLSEIHGETPAMYCSRLEIVDANLTPIGFTMLPKKIGFGNALVENVCVGCTIVLNRKAVELLCENLPANVLVHDWWCYLVLSCFGEIVFDREAPIKYRQHGGNMFGVARNVLGRLRRSFNRSFGPSNSRHWRSAQAAIFLATFGDRIPIQQRQVLNEFVMAKSSWMCRLRLALSNRIWRQQRLDGLSWRLLILMNRY